jgi:murein L,D-transpeptidase YafK
LCHYLTDDKIKELYILGVEAKSHGQEEIPIHIFPARLDHEGMQKLKIEYAASPHLIKFWENLQPMFEDFEKTKKLRKAKVNKKGEYHF